MKRAKINKTFLLSIILLSGYGFLIFYSASLSLYTKENGAGKTVMMQGLGLVLGFIGLFICSKIKYTFWKKFAYVVMGIAILINLLILVPGLGMEHGGAKRWVDLKFMNFQPSEFLKIGYIIFLAALLSKIKERTESLKGLLYPFITATIPVLILMFIQKDTDTMLVICGAGFIMLFAAGAKFKHLVIMFLIGAACLGVYASQRPYIMERIKAYFDPTLNTLSTGYQAKQSLLAIGSGGLTGRGFGQSIQKFGSLPEPIGDAIFAVGAEEFGFIGTLTLIVFYLLFAYVGLSIAFKSPDIFSRLVVVGIVILVMAESFMNMGAMLKLIPLSGQPLLFVSHGGTALALIIAQMGIVLNISKFSKKNKLSTI